jgi:hypothetical protein
MTECAGTKWKNSYVPRGGSKEKANFLITSEDASGNFVGVFQDITSVKLEVITGHCSASDIWFTRVTTAGVYQYEGKFTYVDGEKMYIDGRRLSLSLVAADAKTLFEAGKKLLPPPDDWVAERDTT